MNLSTVRGFVGELLVKRRLQKEGVHTVQHLGKAKSIDLLLTLNGSQITIDVKASMLKAEFGGNARNWGWALNRNHKAPSVTHFVCVALSDALEIERTFVISAKDYERFAGAPAGFGSVTRAFVLLCDGEPSTRSPPAAVKLIADSRELLAEGVAREVQEGERLRDALVI